MNKKVSNLEEREINLLPEEKRAAELKEQAARTKPVVEVSLHEPSSQDDDRPVAGGWLVKLKKRIFKH